jgi:hypothetical protein
MVVEDAHTLDMSKQVRDANVVAALSIANVVKSSLGPVGLDKSEFADVKAARAIFRRADLEISQCWLTMSECAKLSTELHNHLIAIA